MNKKVRNVIIAIIVVILIVVGTMYLIDLNRMKNNKKVVFSTWGRKYAPAVNELEIEKEKEISKLAKMYIAMIEDIMAKDQGLQGGIKFIAIDFTNFRRPLNEDEQENAKKEIARMQLIEFATKEDEEKWERKIKSKPIEEETKQEIVKYLEEKYPDIEIKQNTIDELKEQELVTKDGVIEDGLIICLSSLPKIIEENKAQINLTKYRGPLGAYFIEFEMKYKNDEWELKSISEAIS